MHRRTLLGRGMALGMALLAGCGGNGGGGTPTGSADVMVDVGPGSEFRFEPETFSVGVGETVRWAFRSAGHNVKPESTPDGADWAGSPGGEFDTLENGEFYEATFPVAGEYEYVCAPHASAGMVGSFTVEG